MTQLSRPYQIALVALGLLAAVWFLALRSHSASTSSGGSSASPPVTSSPAAKSASPAAKPAAPSSGSSSTAPGVAGLTRAIEKAHGAVAQSEQNAKQVQGGSARASGEAPAAAAGTTSKSGAQAPPSATPKRSASTQKSSSAGAGTAGASRSRAGAAASMQATVEGELKRGKLVTILFWNPKATVDQAVHSALQSAGRALGGKLAVFDAGASQVGSFGSFTRAVQVYQTPTILIVNARGQGRTLAGLTDAFSIEQAIGEAKH